MRVKRSVLILLVGAIFGAIGCQEAAQQTRFRVRVPEGSGLHDTQTVRIGVSAQADSEVQLRMEPEDCGVLADLRVTTDEHNTANVVFTAGEVETDCQVTVTGTLGDQTSETHVMVHPPKAEAQVTPWTGSAPAPAITISPKVSADDSTGVNRFEYFITQGEKTAIESMKVTFAAETTVKVLSALSTDFNFLEPPPAAQSNDRKTWTISGETPLNSVTVEASSEGNTGGTATFEITLGHSEGTSSVTLAPVGPM
jgi:hypothetical protein